MSIVSEKQGEITISLLEEKLITFTFLKKLKFSSTKTSSFFLKFLVG